jgi:hypothetical protein
MPRIPVYTQQTQAPAGASLGNLRVPDMNLDAVGKGLQQVGQSMGQVASMAMKIQEENQKTKALESLLNDEMSEKQALNDFKTSGDIAPGAEGFTKTFLEGFDKRAQERLKNMPEGPGKRYYQQGVLRMRSSLFDQAISFEAMEGQKYTINVAKQAARGYAGLSADNPDPTEIANRVGEYGAWVDSMQRLSPSQKQELKNFAFEMNYTAALESVIDKDPEGFLKRAESKDGDELLSNISPEKRDTFIKAARTSMNQKMAIYRGELSSRVNDSVAMAQQGILDPNPIRQDEFVRAYGEKEGATKYKSYQQTQVMAGQIRNFSTMPAADIAAFIERNQPAPGEGFAERQARHNVLTQAGVQTLKNRESDPATFMIQNSRPVNAAYSEFARVQASNASAEEKQAAANRYVTATLAEQERLGVVNPRILSKQMRDNLSRRMAAGNETAADIAADLEQTYGKQNFGSIMQEMMQDNKLPMPMMIIPDLDAPDAREAVSRVTSTDRKALEAGIAPAEIKRVKERVLDHVSTLRSSGGPMSPMMAAQISAYQETMERLALERLGRGASKSGADAADVANEMLLGKYQFQGTLRLPRDVDYGVAKRLLNDNLGESMNALTFSDVPLDRTQARTPSEALAEWKSTIQARSFWISNNDTTGAQLWAQGENGTWYPVMRNGKQIEVLYDAFPVRRSQAQERQEPLPSMGLEFFQ